MINIHELLELAISQRASDLLMKAGSPPALRINGDLVLTEIAPLSTMEMSELAQSVVHSASRDYYLNLVNPDDPGHQEPDIAGQQMERLAHGEEVDLVFTIPDLVRVRCNLFLQQNSVAAALRIIPLRPFKVEELNLPPILNDLADARKGLVLVTGPTGCGKSTTLAAMIQHINETREGNIISIEDPIEYTFQDERCMIYQREVGRDTVSYDSALFSVLRQCPDVIMIGEMRNVETMRVAMMAAEMGHLVLSSVHTISASATVDRIINAFPDAEQNQVRFQLANVLNGVISQRLMKRADGRGRIPSVEILINTPTVRKAIEEGSSSDVYTALREGRHFGMNTMNQALERLVQAKLITPEDAMHNAGNQQELRQMLRRS